MSTTEVPKPRIWPIFLMYVVAIALFAVMFFQTLGGSAASRAVRRAQERGDCAREIQEHQDSIRDAEYHAKARLDAAYILAQLEVSEDPTRRAFWVEELGRLQADLSAAIQRTDSMPPVQKLVAERCPAA